MSQPLGGGLGSAASWRDSQSGDPGCNSLTAPTESRERRGRDRETGRMEKKA